VIRIAYHTLGCKVNQYETEKIRESLERAGFETVAFDSPADACVINTCTVTSVADAKSRAAIRRAHRANPNALVVVTGCYAELEPDAIRALDGIDLVVPNGEKEAIPERVIARFAAGGEWKVESGKPGQSEEPTPQSAIGIPYSPFRNPQSAIRIPYSPFRNPQSAIRIPYSPFRIPHSAIRIPHSPFPIPRLRTRAMVKVQDGCDHFCSYCVVPYARRGKSSRPLDDVLAEVRALAEFGYREIVLTGIRLGAYAQKSEVRSAKSEGSGLPKLVRAVAAVDGIERVRLSSVEPWEVDKALLDAMRQPKVCRHLHIPLQSGDDEVLARMNRPYTAAQYLRIVSRVREAIPGIGITTDVMVGFPGETEEAFANTRRLIDEIGFSRLHVFRYSPRKRTAAASMPDQIPAQVKKRRAQNLIELGNNAMRLFAESIVGQTVEVLVERRSRRPNQLIGFTDNYVEVGFPGDVALAGRIVGVRIVGVDQDGCQVLGVMEGR
jgi:threonylcarbamoyladenosine tRNA methylthiotransferase MtaB